MNEYDANLGWRPKTGTFIYPAYDSSNNNINVTVLESGLRKTYPNQTIHRTSKPKMIFLGGSFTFGWAINDNQTYPWLVQEKEKDFEVLNYGCAGYGTFQSLLKLEQELPRLKDVEYVFYGFIEHHEMRNFGPANWKARLARAATKGTVFLPSASLDSAGNLIRHIPENYTSLIPLVNVFSTLHIIEKLYFKMNLQLNESNKRKITFRILTQMNTLCQKNGTKFIVIILHAKPQTMTSYKAFFTDHNISFINCNIPLTEKTTVKGEGHPNALMNFKWSDEIMRTMKSKSQSF